MFMRTPLYLNILKLRKVKDRLRLDVTKKNPTFEDRLDYALDSRANLNNSGEKLHNFNSNVVLEEIKDGPVKIYKFIPPNSSKDKYGIYFHGGGYFAGSITSHKNLISQISNDSNLTVYYFEYRLSPEYNFPSAHEDAKLAVDFIKTLHPDDQSIWICLLYTSPSPRDGLLSRMPSSA